MQNHLYVGASLLLLVGCQTDSPTRFSGGDGSSEKGAIVIHANNEVDGIAAEHLWIHEHMPGGIPKTQSLIVRNGHEYDRLEVTGADGSSNILYFDISRYFGKY
jgi:hypothetical protein